MPSIQDLCPIFPLFLCKWLEREDYDNCGQILAKIQPHNNLLSNREKQNENHPPNT
jgi:hypothetical protein